MGYERTDRVESAASLRSEAGSSTCIRRKGGLRCESTCGVYTVEEITAVSVLTQRSIGTRPR